MGEENNNDNGTPKIIEAASKGANTVKVAKKAGKAISKNPIIAVIIGVVLIFTIIICMVEIIFSVLGYNDCGEYVEDSVSIEGELLKKGVSDMFSYSEIQNIIDTIMFKYDGTRFSVTGMELPVDGIGKPCYDQIENDYTNEVEEFTTETVVYDGYTVTNDYDTFWNDNTYLKYIIPIIQSKHSTSDIKYLLNYEKNKSKNNYLTKLKKIAQNMAGFAKSYDWFKVIENEDTITIERVGWYNGSKLVTYSDICPTSQTSDITLTAKWEKVSKITLESTGPDSVTGKTVSPKDEDKGTRALYKKSNEDTVYVEQNCRVERLSITLPKIDNYDFDGYFLGSEMKIDANGNILDTKRSSADATWVAHWSRRNYIATLEHGGADNATGTDSTPEALYQKCAGNKDFYTDSNNETKVDKIILPIRGFDLFLGYYLDANGNGTIDDDEVQTIDKDGKILYNEKMTDDQVWIAKWDTKVNVSYIGKDKDGSLSESDFIETDVELSSLYDFDTNVNTEGDEKFERTVIGEKTGEEVQSKVVRWTYNLEYNKEYETGSSKSATKFYEEAEEAQGQNPEAQIITVGKPADDFGSYDGTEETNPLIKGAKMLLGILGFNVEADETYEADNRRYINMYPVWDDGAEIMAKDLYVSLQECNDGEITEEWLLQYVEAYDKEAIDSTHTDGIVKGSETGTGLTFSVLDTGFENSFKKRNCEGSEQIYYKVVDAAGNVTYKRITVTIVDSSFKELPSPEVGIRSVRWQYYNMMNKDANGNLLDGCVDTFSEDSIWVKNPEYVECLTTALNKERTGEIIREFKMFGITIVKAEVKGSGTWKRVNKQTGEEFETVPTRYTFCIPHDQVEWTKEYIENNGVGKTWDADPTAADNSLTRYYQHFKDLGLVTEDQITHRSNVNVDQTEDQNIIPDGWESFASKFAVHADDLYGSN